MKRIIWILIISCVILSCNKKPRDIEYGSDECYYCSMKIVEKKFGAQMVTEKGKIQMYDSAECLIKDVLNHPDKKYSFLKATNYLTDEWIDAEHAYFLISKNIPSPMGANLSAYDSKKEVEDMQKKNEGEVFNWSEIKVYFE
ncbi:hypothetical protein UJ101_02276 [Flavobacteriaceae bacterium UJ101]|nr:hypothetical protein UJ101_02276 [Flavobacteriaceae bacterium UJ101]